MNKINQESLKLIMIKSKTNNYISDNVKNDGYFSSRIPNLYFDGIKLEAAYLKNWYKVKAIPKKIEKELPARKINMRYELKEGFPESKLTPKIISYSEFDHDSDISGLYTYKYENEEAGMEELEFEINVIEEFENGFEMVEMKYQPQYNFLDRLKCHPATLHLRPCKLSREESYKIIRNHVKTNINPQYARITSDYDFCFTVKKVIELYKEQSYTVDINVMHKRRKPKYETRYRQHKEMELYNIAPKSYQSYNLAPEFEGDTYEDMMNNINTYLNDLMSKINEPIIECSHCKGQGVLLNDKN